MSPTLETVLGSVPLALLGLVLPHEHFPLSRGIREEDEPPAGYVLELERLQREVMREAQSYGVGAITEVTPIGVMRALPMMQRLSRQTGLHVVASTGFYTEGKRPTWVAGKSAEELAELMVRELTEGVGGTGVKPWMIKVAASGPLASEEDRNVFRAAALASQATGAAITTHSCGVTRNHFDFLVEQGADPSRLYLGHADLDPDREGHLHIARHGGHLIFTCWGIQHFVDQDTLDGHVLTLCEAGFPEAVLLSIDYAALVGDNRMDLISTEYECPRRTPAFLFRYTLPRLRGKGVSEELLHMFLHENPHRMLAREPGPGNRESRDSHAACVRISHGFTARPFSSETEKTAIRLVNAYTAGWRYTRPIEQALIEHWKMLGEAFQPERMLIASRDGVPRAFLHGERDRNRHLVHLLALAPGAVEEGVWLLEQAEAQARAEGALWLCGPTCASARFYGGYLLGLEPYHPHWAVDGTEAFVQAGYRTTEREALLVADLAREVPAAEPPAGYEVADTPCEVGFRAKAFRLIARKDDVEVAHCGAHFYPELSSPRGGPVGQVGPVGTDAAHRGKGLATALVKLALHRLQQWGAAEALISTGLENYPALRAYEKAGFVRRSHLIEWQKDLGRRR